MFLHLLPFQFYLAAIARDIRIAVMNTRLAAAPKECICQRMHDKGNTGVPKIDKWLLSGLYNWPHDWFRQLYENRIEDDAFLQQRKYFQDGGSMPMARYIKYRIEQNCKAEVHYPAMLADAMYGGRAVLTSLDEDRAKENAEALEYHLWLGTNPAEQRKLTEYRGEDASAGESDVLMQQRAERTEHEERKVKKMTAENIQLDFAENDAEAHASRKERKALSTIAAEKATPFDKLVWDNKRRIRARDEQARRDLWHWIRKTDAATQTLLIAYVQEKVEEGKKRGNYRPYTALVADIRKSARASLACAAA